VIKNSKINDNVSIEGYSIIEGAEVEMDAFIEAFSRIKQNNS